MRTSNRATLAQGPRAAASAPSGRAPQTPREPHDQVGRVSGKRHLALVATSALQISRYVGIPIALTPTAWRRVNTPKRYRIRSAMYAVIGCQT